MLAYITASRTVVLYGGTTNSGGSGAIGDTWIYDGVDWQRLFETSAPGLRHGVDLVYDSARDVVVLYGGGPPLEGVTWEFDGSQ